MPRLVIIDGKPGSGKSTLADIVRERVGVPVVSKDGIKEYLFDVLGSKDREWSQAVGAASMEMLYAYINEFLKKGENVVVESPFWADFATERLSELCQRTNAEVLELHCIADAQTRSERVGRRLQNGRHAGHVDQEIIFDDAIDDERYRPLGIGRIISIDTTKLAVDDYDNVLRDVSSFLSEQEEREWRK